MSQFFLICILWIISECDEKLTNMYVQKLVNDDNAFHFFISLLNQRLKIDMSTGTIYDFSVRDNSGDLVSLDKYR